MPRTQAGLQRAPSQEVQLLVRLNQCKLHLCPLVGHVRANPFLDSRSCPATAPAAPKQGPSGPPVRRWAP